MNELQKLQTDCPFCKRKISNVYCGDCSTKINLLRREISTMQSELVLFEKDNMKLEDVVINQVEGTRTFWMKKLIKDKKKQRNEFLAKYIQQLREKITLDKNRIEEKRKNIAEIRTRGSQRIYQNMQLRQNMLAHMKKNNCTISV